MGRTFVIKKAKREQLPLLIGLFGATGSGKTKSALRLATGIQRVRGGNITVIDTEAKRALHYADDHDFEHMEFGAPFRPSAYLDAIKYAVAQGAGVVIVDSCSHMHEGEGGLLDWHDEIVTERAGKDAGFKQRAKYNMSAWIEPKRDFGKLRAGILHLDAALIMCFRAKAKIKPRQGGEPEEQGWCPIVGDELPYELALMPLLEPGCGGMPTWSSDKPGTREFIKAPGHFAELFRDRRPLDEDHGEALARWADGTSAPVLIKGKPPSEYDAETLSKLVDHPKTKPHIRKAAEAELERRITEAADAHAARQQEQAEADEAVAEAEQAAMDV